MGRRGRRDGTRLDDCTVTRGPPPLPCAPASQLTWCWAGWGQLSPPRLLALHVPHALDVTVGCRQVVKRGGDRRTRCWYPVTVAPLLCCCHVPTAAHWLRLDHGWRRILGNWGWADGAGLLNCTVTRGAPSPPCSPAGCLSCWAVPLELSPPHLLTLHVRHSVNASVVCRQVDKWGGDQGAGSRCPAGVALMLSSCCQLSTGQMERDLIRCPPCLLCSDLSLLPLCSLPIVGKEHVLVIVIHRLSVLLVLQWLQNTRCPSPSLTGCHFPC